MDSTFFVQRLPEAVQDKIFAIADGCLSRQHRGDPRVCKFWLFALGPPENGIAVLEEEWRAEADLNENEDGGELCQTCSIRQRDLQRANVGFVKLTVHRRVTRVPNTYASTEIIGETMDFDDRAVCRECSMLLFCGIWTSEEP